MPNIEYTYYGDLLGIGNYYKLSPKLAGEKLNLFYNVAFKNLKNLRTDFDQSCKIHLFSDSIVITGENHLGALKLVNNLYSQLLFENLLLRGAIVKGRLIYQRRDTIENFEKNLPIDDTLAKAVGLEKTFKGSRLIVENRLAEDIFSNCPEWLTNEGYSHHRNRKPEHSEVLRRICPTPDNTHYEMLFNLLEYDKPVIQKIKDDLRYVIKVSSPDIKIHYSETLDLLKRSEVRYQLTI